MADPNVKPAATHEEPPDDWYEAHMQATPPPCLADDDSDNSDEDLVECERCGCLELDSRAHFLDYGEVICDQCAWWAGEHE